MVINQVISILIQYFGEFNIVSCCQTGQESLRLIEFSYETIGLFSGHGEVRFTDRKLSGIKRSLKNGINSHGTYNHRCQPQYQ